MALGFGELESSLSSAPQMTNLFEVQLPLDDENIISPRVVGVTLPFPRGEADTAKLHNSKWYFFAADDIGNLTLEIIEGEDGKTEQWVKSWFKLIRNSDGSYNPPAHYKRHIRVFHLNARGDRIKEFVLQDYFPLGITDSAYAYEGSEVVKYSIEFSGDDLQTK